MYTQTLVDNMTAQVFEFQSALSRIMDILCSAAEERSPTSERWESAFIEIAKVYGEHSWQIIQIRASVAIQPKVTPCKN